MGKEDIYQAVEEPHALLTDIETTMQASPSRKSEVTEEQDHVTRRQDHFFPLMTEVTKS